MDAGTFTSLLEWSLPMLIVTVVSQWIIKRIVGNR